jgi:5'-nucleotidase
MRKCYTRYHGGMPKTLLLCLLLALAAPAVAADGARTTTLRIVAVNDFHGHLQADPGADPAGGAVALAATLARLRAQQPVSVFVSAGDLIGASPLPSALAHDEPTLALFRHLGLAANATGNHELDSGLLELKRQEKLAGFPFLSANLIDTARAAPVFAPYRIVEVGGVRVAFVGATVRNALKPLEPDSVPGLRLDEEAAALEAQAAALRAQGVRIVVALLHEGAGAQDAVVPAQDCGALAGRAREITQELAPDFDLVLSAHTHALYACQIGGRWLTQGGAYGRYLTVADLRVDRDSGDVLDVAVRNEPVRLQSGERADPQVQRLVDEAVAAAARIADAPVATIPGGRVSATPEAGQGSALGRLVANAQLHAAAARGAQLACTNPSSVPRDLVASLPKDIASYADVRAVQPYGNRLKVRRVRGVQLRALLEQQWREGAAPVWLSCSAGLEYRFDAAHHVAPGTLRWQGRVLGEDEELRLVVNSYLARGGQGFTALVDAPELGEAGIDLDALLRWLRR